MGEEKYLTESGWRLVDFGLLTHGYIRKYVKAFSLKPTATPRELIELCQKFATPIVFDDEAADPVNHILPADEKESDKYKEAGNRYFKAKDYEQAIIKYRTAMRFNPNNHLLYSNRASCYFIRLQFDAAQEDISQCLQIDPSFIKGWSRYGRILEKLRDYKRAIWLTNN